MKRTLPVALLIVLCLMTGPAHAYWIWTPQTGKFVNPKYAVKPTPKEQFELALGFYDSKKYQDARREFKKLVKAYPKSAEGAESQYYLGVIEEQLGNPYEAFLAYQKVIDKYPFSERIQEILQREFDIADKFMAGEKRKALGVALPVENPAIEIYTKIVENSTYGPLASKAEYKLGLVLKGLTRYYEAEDAFNKVISNYPDSEWAAPAKFQVASCRAAVSKGTEYDQDAAQDAKKKFEEFVKSHPDAALSDEAEKNINELKEKEAASDFNIAGFYEKQHALESAVIYYNAIIEKYPESALSKKAEARIRALEPIIRKNEARKKPKK